jgi:hypothetical protein
MFTVINKWADEKLAYLAVKEVVRSSESAKQHLSLLDVYEAALTAMSNTNVPALQKLGGEIRAAKYETQYSKWVYEKPEEITVCSCHSESLDVLGVSFFCSSVVAGLRSLKMSKSHAGQRLESVVANQWTEMHSGRAAKRARLDDDLARESYAEHTRLLANQYMRKAAMLEAWAAEQLRYLAVKENVQSSHDASVHLSLLDAFQKEMAVTTATSLASLRSLDAEIVARKYETSLSSYSYEKVPEIRAADGRLQQAWTDLEARSQTKLAVLQDDLARHEFKERVELWASCFEDAQRRLMGWIDDKRKYLAAREQTDSVPLVELQLSLLDAFTHEKADRTAGSYAEVRRLSADIQSAKYTSSLSSWGHPAPGPLAALEQKVLTGWTDLDAANVVKQSWLDDALAREQLRHKVYLQADQHVREHQRLDTWVADKTSYLQTSEAIDSIAQARLCLRLLDAFDTEQKSVWSTTVTSLNALGAEILATTYSSSQSQWKYEDPSAVQQRKSKADASWKTFEQLSAAKRTRLDRVLKDEITKENLRLDFAGAAKAFSRFVADNVAVIPARSASRDSQSGVLGFTVDEFEAYGQKQIAEDDRILREGTTLTVRVIVCCHFVWWCGDVNVLLEWIGLFF